MSTTDYTDQVSFRITAINVVARWQVWTQWGYIICCCDRQHRASCGRRLNVKIQLSSLDVKPAQ